MSYAESIFYKCPATFSTSLACYLFQQIKKSIDITPILEIGRTDILTKILEENEDCISYLPYFTTEEKVKSGKLVYLDVHDIKTGIWKQLIYRKNKWLSNSMKVFLEYVKKYEFKG